MNRMERLEYRVRELAGEVKSRDARIAELEKLNAALAERCQRQSDALSAAAEKVKTACVCQGEAVSRQVFSDPDAVFDGTYPLPGGVRAAGRKDTGHDA